MSRPMLVLIADKFPTEGQRALLEMGLQVECRPELGADNLGGALQDTGADILIVRSTKVTADAFGASAGLSLVIRAGAGVNTIDLEAASRFGVYVANCPGKNAIAVAELTMGLLLAADRHIPDATADLRAGKWDKKKYATARGLFGRSLGLVGFGNVAREVARRASAFGMTVRSFSIPFDTAAAKVLGVEQCGTLEDLLRRSDVVSLHVPYSEATHHLIGEAELRLMPAGSVLLHAARGGVVNDAALARVVAEGHVTAGLDVFEGEPASGQAGFESPVRNISGIYATPHVGASTDQAQEAIADEVVRIVDEYLHAGAVRNAVNVITDRPARYTVVLRHLDRIGVLATVLQAFREEDLNVKEMHNVVFSGNVAASATINLERAPSSALISRLHERDDILAVEVRSMDSAGDDT